MTEKEILTSIYDTAQDGELDPSLPESVLSNCEIIIGYQETRKAVLTVAITLLLKKSASPEQDIRMHQVQQPRGFSGRRLDTDVVTPFMKDKGFPSMAESGWLTRSLEQPAPYNLDYPGNVSPARLKEAFLNLIHDVECNGISPRDVLIHLFQELIKIRERNANATLIRPNQIQTSHLSVRATVDKIVNHYQQPISGVSRLPVLAIHAILKTLTTELDRYRGCEVLPLEHHTSADSKTNLIGDVHVIHSDGSLYEGYEIKHNTPVTSTLIRDCHEKFRSIPVERYYILTTYSHDDYSQFDSEIARVAKQHGCQMIVNGVDRTLLYYLRLVRSTDDFVNEYVSNLENTPGISYELKMAWNETYQAE